MPALYVTVNVQQCYMDISNFINTSNYDGMKGMEQGSDKGIDKGSVQGSVGGSIKNSGSNGNSEISSIKKMDKNTVLSEWVWCLSVRVCEVLHRIESGVAKRSSDIWRLGNVLASTCVKKNGNDQKDLGSDLESSAELGASSFLSYYLENLSGRSPDYQLNKNENENDDESSKEGKQENDNHDENENTNDKVDPRKSRNDGDVSKLGVKSEDDELIDLWERNFFEIPLPYNDLHTQHTQHRASHLAVRQNNVQQDCEESVNTGDERTGNVELRLVGEGLNLGEKEVNNEERKTEMEMEAEGEKEEKDKSGGNEMEIQREQEKEKEIKDQNDTESFEIQNTTYKRLIRDILILSIDSRLLLIRDTISHPVETAFKKHNSKDKKGFKKELYPRIVGSNNINGKISWKKNSTSHNSSTKDQKTDLELFRDSNSTLCVNTEFCTTSGILDPGSVILNSESGNFDPGSISSPHVRGSIDLLALLIARVLHGLASKHLTTAAWKNEIGWAQYREINFECVLAMCMKLL